jgi:hypothetical protein
MARIKRLTIAGGITLLAAGCVPPPARQIQAAPAQAVDPDELKRYNAEAYCGRTHSWCKAVLTASGKRYNLAVELYEKNDFDTAYEILKPNFGSFTALLFPEDADRADDNMLSPSLNLGGILFWKLNKKDTAREYFIRSARLDDEHAKENLGKLKSDPQTFSYRRQALMTAESVFKGYGGGSDLSVDVHVK